MTRLYDGLQTNNGGDHWSYSESSFRHLWEKQPIPFMMVVSLPGFEKNISQIRAVYKSTLFSKWSLPRLLKFLLHRYLCSAPHRPTKETTTLPNRIYSVKVILCSSPRSMRRQADDVPHQPIELLGIRRERTGTEYPPVTRTNVIVSLIRQDCPTLYLILTSI
jgi:hypothetical protein